MNDPQSSSSSQLRETLRRNHRSIDAGVFAVCSAHPSVLAAAIQHSIKNDSILHVESTSSQVNQFGGYTGQTPQQFAHAIHRAAQLAGLPSNRIVLGGDHLGPFPWRSDASRTALDKGCELIRSCVLAGYTKIHLDPSMPCADDIDEDFNEATIAHRAALLCSAAEEASRGRPAGSPPLVFVIGTEVPAPGGEQTSAHSLSISRADDVHQTLSVFQKAFADKGLEAAWERVVALVVQPGVDFGSENIFHYDGARARELSGALARHPGLVFEAHSTDYQLPSALAQMVEDHFAILKVGPWLTFAYREAILALSAIERELFKASTQGTLSQVREALEKAMAENPVHWRSYYHGDEANVRRELIYSYSDRCRYYWPAAGIQEEIGKLLNNLASRPIPLTLISQFLPEEYAAIRAGVIHADPAQIIQEHIQQVLRIYAAACRQQSATDDIHKSISE